MDLGNFSICSSRLPFIRKWDRLGPHLVYNGQIEYFFDSWSFQSRISHKFLHIGLHLKFLTMLAEQGILCRQLLSSTYLPKTEKWIILSPFALALKHVFLEFSAFQVSTKLLKNIHVKKKLNTYSNKPITFQLLLLSTSCRSGKVIFKSMLQDEGF